MYCCIWYYVLLYVVLVTTLYCIVYCPATVYISFTYLLYAWKNFQPHTSNTVILS